MRIVLIGNYVRDQQESMSRFAKMLKRGLIAEGHECEIWGPNAFLGRYHENHYKGLGKWLGYVDKWIIYPVILGLKARSVRFKSPDVRFHICDHSNAPYLAYLPSNQSSITCHDVIAIRGALGFPDAHCRASKLGNFLQKWILRSLLRAPKIAFDSRATLEQLSDLDHNKNSERSAWKVIHCAINADFQQMEAVAISPRLEEVMVPAKGYILHVGSNLPRKNRKLLIDVLTSLGDKWDGNICFAGQPADDDLLKYADKYGHRHRVFSVEGPGHEMLNALYCGSTALLFPSWSEGFGWPVIEAQICGAAVIASNIQPMPEVGGTGAIYADPNNAATFSEALLSLSDPLRKQKLISEGFQNARRFDLTQMTRSYLAMFEV